MTIADDINPISPLAMTREQFVAACAQLGVGSGRAKTGYAKVYRQGIAHAQPAKITVPPIVKRLEEQTPEGLTIKFVQRLPNDNHQLAHKGIDFDDIESVIIPMIGRSTRKTHTLCVSSQVGCAMGCGFCETAQMGLIRSLTAEEIVAQWWAAKHIEGIHIDNIVFMGMGEPLDNLDEVFRAIECLTDRAGAAIPMSAITISTVGRVDGLRRIKQQVQTHGWRKLGLALSLNAPNDQVRDELMPLNKKWNMQGLQDILVELREVRGGRKIMIEYVLIPGVNNASEHAAQVAEWMKPFMKGTIAAGKKRGHGGLLNIIPYNPIRNSPWPAPTEAQVEEFVGWLMNHGIFVNRRRTKGRSTMAACGQLGTEEIRKRNFVPLTTNQECND
ncbi:MAG: 23S rRNA (adenine(2503)-C(2))-methyltransferase RlmN [Phycisphaerales bacterium]|nr:23S rRNA (adenine(2503)-C(2))-methyltransferase RlmN [Phycisphaerales bacterium]